MKGCILEGSALSDRVKQSSRTGIHNFIVISIDDQLKYNMDNPILIQSIFFATKVLKGFFLYKNDGFKYPSIVFLI